MSTRAIVGGALAFALAFALAGCGVDAAVKPLPADVDAVLAGRCQRCHGAPTDQFAPMSMVSWNDMHALSPGSSTRAVYEVMAARIVDPDLPMPPFRTTEHDLFSDAERLVLQAWVAAGAPPRSDADAAPE